MPTAIYKGFCNRPDSPSSVIAKEKQTKKNTKLTRCGVRLFMIAA